MEIRLLGGVVQGADDISYTTRIGMTTGEMVPAPAAVDSAKGIPSLAPYTDQNAWRWNYMWQLLEVWHYAFHETDPYHGVMPGGHMGLHAPFDFPHTRFYTNNALSVIGHRATLGRPTYGLAPHLVLLGLARDDAANGKLLWSALANGGRAFVVYDAGDGYGQKLLHADFSVTPAGASFARVLAGLRAKEEVWLATRPVLTRDVLVLSDGGLPVEVYEALTRCGVLPDYGSNLAGRRVVLCVGEKLAPVTATRLRAFAAGGGQVVLLGGAGAGWADADMVTRLVLPAGDAMTHETFRRQLATALDAAGVSRGAEALGRDGNALPTVEALLLETMDASQRYLAVYADCRLPGGAAKVAGEIVLHMPGVAAVYDVYGGRAVPLANGRVAFELGPGQGAVHSLLTEPPGTVSVEPMATSLAPGGPLRVGLRVTRGDGQPATTEHAVNVRVLGPDGAPVSGLATHLSVTGRGVATLLPSWADPDGEWRIEAHDLTTGSRAAATVTKLNTGGLPPPVAPPQEFLPPAPDLTLECVPLALPGDLHLLPLRVRLRGALREARAMQLGLVAPEGCLAGGRSEQVVVLSPAQPEGEARWALLLSRQAALALYYAAQPAGFHVGPQCAVPAGWAPLTLRLTFEGPPLRVALPGAERPAVGRDFAWRVPLPLMPFEAQPPRLGRLSADAVMLAVVNGTGQAWTGELALAAVAGLRAPARVPFTVPAGATANVLLPLRVDNTAPPGRGLLEVPLRLVAGDTVCDVGRQSVEVVEQRAWLVRAGDLMDAQRSALPFAADGRPATPADWQPALGDAVVPVAPLLPAGGDVAYAYTQVFSPTARAVAFRLPLVGAEARCWLNGALAHASRLAADAGADAQPELTQDVAAHLRAGWNQLGVEVRRAGRRFLPPPLVLTDRAGRALRDLRCDCQGAARAATVPGD